MGVTGIDGISEADARFLARALTLARRGRGRVSPNPMVGALIVREGVVLAEGYHRRLGGPHAEIDALDRLPRKSAARGATLYVNLEPCCHQGRTPPCVDRLIASGIARVVACHLDPEPQVAGRGFDRLRQAGLQVAVGGPIDEALDLNLAFLVSRSERRVAVTLKWAMSLDGKIATRTGDSQWISSPEGRRWALRLREYHDAILVGSGTALADDPRLTRRLGGASGPIVRVVLDRRLRLSPRCRLLVGNAAAGPVLVYTENDELAARHRLEDAGAEVIVRRRVAPLQVARDLAARGLNDLLVEGGGEVLEAFRRAAVFDRVAVCIAPLLIGGRTAAPAFGGLGASRLTAAARLERLRVRRRGEDLVLEGLRQGRLASLRERLACPPTAEATE